MNLQEWVFPEGHAVYFREPFERRWTAPPPLMQPRAYLPSIPPGAPMPRDVREPLLMQMVGHPSVDIHQSGQGNTVQTVRLRSAHAAQIDLAGIRRLAQEWIEVLRRLSRGPYDRKALRRMGHPYGYLPGGSAMPRLGHGKALPTFSRALRRQAPPRAPVPNRAVINIDSGELERAWRFSVMVWYGGVTLNFWNEAKTDEGAPYPWFVMHGTVMAQAHGPLPYVAEQLLPEVQNEWRQGAAAAARAEAALSAQFPQEQIAAQEQQFDEGGFM